MEQEQNIRWDSANPKKIDLTVYNDIRFLANCIRISGFVFPFLHIAIAILVGYGRWDFLSVILVEVMWYILCSRTYRSLIYRKENAVFLSCFIFYSCLFFNLLFEVMRFFYLDWIPPFFIEFIIFFIVFIISTLLWILGLTYGQPFIDVFPKKYRSHSISDILLVVLYLVMPFIGSLIGGFVKAEETRAMTIDTKSIISRNMNTNFSYATNLRGLIDVITNGILVVRIGVENTYLPVELKNGFTLMKISLDKEFIIFHFEHDVKEMQEFDEKKERRRLTEQLFDNGYGNIINLVYYMGIYKGFSVQCEYVLDKSKGKYEYHIAAEEIKELYN